MTHDHEEIETLLRRLLESYTEHHTDLIITKKVLPKRVDWRITANLADQGKLAGQMGSHIKAIKFLLMEWGDLSEQLFTCVLLPAHCGEPRARGPRKNAGREFVAIPFLELLRDLLTSFMQEMPGISVDQQMDAAANRHVVTFCISCRLIQDYERLVTPVDADETETDLADLTILTALGTLFRAAGHQHGVTFNLEVPSR